MKLTKVQLQKFGIKFINQLREELKEDKPFGTDVWPYEIAEIVEYKHDEENMSEQPGWNEVDEVFAQLFENFENSLK